MNWSIETHPFISVCVRGGEVGPILLQTRPAMDYLRIQFPTPARGNQTPHFHCEPRANRYPVWTAMFSVGDVWAGHSRIDHRLVFERW